MYHQAALSKDVAATTQQEHSKGANAICFWLTLEKCIKKNNTSAGANQVNVPSQLQKK